MGSRQKVIRYFFFSRRLTPSDLSRSGFYVREYAAAQDHGAMICFAVRLRDMIGTLISCRKSVENVRRKLGRALNSEPTVPSQSVNRNRSGTFECMMDVLRDFRSYKRLVPEDLEFDLLSVCNAKPEIAWCHLYVILLVLYVF